MTRSQLITKVANDTNMTAAEVEKVMDGIFGTIGDVLKSGDKVTIAGFGRFEMRERQTKNFTNPKTKVTLSKGGSPQGRRDSDGLSRVTSTPPRRHEGMPPYVCPRSIRRAGCPHPAGSCAAAASPRVVEDADPYSSKKRSTAFSYGAPFLFLQNYR